MNAGRVSGVLRGNGGKVDVETIRKAAEFVSGFDGKIEDAVKAVATVGGFVEACGSDLAWRSKTSNRSLRRTRTSRAVELDRCDMETVHTVPETTLLETRSVLGQNMRRQLVGGIG